jgi:predicted nucleic acid-binding Zn ribbon protein
VSDRSDTNGAVEPTRSAERTSGSGGLGPVLREALGHPSLRGGVSLGRLVRGWEAVVGRHLAGATVPRGLEDGVLVVAAATPAWAAQVRFLSPEMCRRANEVLGSEEVRSVRVVVRPEASKPLPRNRFGGAPTGPEPPPGAPSSDRI